MGMHLDSILKSFLWNYWITVTLKQLSLIYSDIFFNTIAKPPPLSI